MPITTRRVGGGGPKGKGRVRILKDEIRITTEDGTTYTLAKDSTPDYIKLIEGEDLFFSLDKNEAELRALRPFAGNFPMKFVGFSEEDGKARTYIQEGGPRQWRDKNTGAMKKSIFPDRLVFTANFEVVAGKYESVRLPLTLDYLFEDVGDGHVGLIGGGGITLLKTFLSLGGIDFDKDTLKWSAEHWEVLGLVSKIMAERAEDNQFLGGVENGYVKRLSKLDKEAFGIQTKKKKTAKKSKK